MEMSNQKSRNNGVRACAVIPAYNEAKTIGRVIQETKKYVNAVFVVDNGSIDNTAEVACANCADVIPYLAIRGYGAAQYIGHETAIRNGYDYIVQLDADGQHDPKYIPLLLEVACNNNCDIVLGSRFLDNNHRNLSFVRQIGIVFFSRIISLLGHTKITDVTSGFKVYKISSLKKLSRPCNTHPALEQMMEIAKKGMKIMEVAVEMPARNNGKSHLSLGKFILYPVRGIFSIIKVMLFR